MIAEIDPERIDLIRSLETEFAQLRRDRKEANPGRYTYPEDATFFQSIDRKRINTIDEVVAWSRTSHGGKQLPLIQEPPSDGCFRWGLCEPPD